MPAGPPGEGLHPSLFSEDGRLRAQDADNKPLTVRAGHASGYSGARVEATSPEDNGETQVPSHLYLSVGNVVIRGGQAMSGNGLIIVEVPAADPHVPGALWKDVGTLKISAG